MKICGFTFIRNAIKFDFPIVESILSILPICDKVIVAVGKSDDNTLELIKNIGDPRIEIIETIWDEKLREGGHVLAAETNKAFDAIPADYDWCIYIQGDEVIHEQYLPIIKNSMKEYLLDNRVEGLLFKYLHFYGTYSFIGDSRTWYKNEIRIIRNNKNIRSFKDAQGFRLNNRKLNVFPIDAYIYHYGWVRPPEVMLQKLAHNSNFWNNNTLNPETILPSDVFDYSKIDSICRFEGTHPKVMENKLIKMKWISDLNPEKKTFKFKDWVLYKFEMVSGIRLWEYKNYKIIK
jgi:hypothetical protein